MVHSDVCLNSSRIDTGGNVCNAIPSFPSQAFANSVKRRADPLAHEDPILYVSTLRNDILAGVKLVKQPLFLMDLFLVTMHKHADIFETFTSLLTHVGR